MLIGSSQRFRLTIACLHGVSLFRQTKAWLYGHVFFVKKSGDDEDMSDTDHGVLNFRRPWSFCVVRQKKDKEKKGFSNNEDGTAD